MAEQKAEEQQSPVTFWKVISEISVALPAFSVVMAYMFDTLVDATLCMFLTFVSFFVQFCECF